TATATGAMTTATQGAWSTAACSSAPVVNGVGGDSNLSPAATLEYFSGSTAGTAGTGTTTAPTNAGTYTVRASFAGNGNYDPTSEIGRAASGETMATVAITWASPQTYN